MPGQRPTVTGREGDGPVRVRTEVLSRGTEGPYHTLSVAAPAIADRARPGQFVEIAVEAPHALLRRPFSIARAGSRGARGIIDVVFDAHGPGTAWLTDLSPRSRIDVVGPLGTWFQLPPADEPCLLVGGGYGVAPLYLLADDLNAVGCRIDVVVGAATEQRLFNPLEAKRISSTATFTTEDGSYGTRGRVTDVMADVIDRAGTKHVFACGPMGMLRAVAAVCADKGVASQLAVEEHMACGVGVCWTCVVPTRQRGSDEVHNRRACIDGPVFDGAEIMWDQTRWRDAVPTWLAGDVADQADAVATSPDPDEVAPPPPSPIRPAAFASSGPSTTTSVAPPAWRDRDLGLPSTREFDADAERERRRLEREEREREWEERERERQARRDAERERLRLERERYEREREEQERLREERRARDAEERARREAEREARLEAERLEREARRAEMEAERARLRAEREARLHGEQAPPVAADDPPAAAATPSPLAPAAQEPGPRQPDVPDDDEMNETQEIVRTPDLEPEAPLFGARDEDQA